MSFSKLGAWLIADVSHASSVVLLLVLILIVILVLFYRLILREREDLRQIVAQAKEATEQARLAAVVERDLFNRNLQQVQRFEVLGSLTGSVAHDFNNIITAILGYTSLIMGDLNTTTTLYRNLSEIHKAGERASALVAQLMSFARKRPVIEKVIDIKLVLKDLERMLRRLIPENIEMHLDIDSDLWNIMGDQAQIEQIMVNLVVNAGDAMPKGGKLWITANNITLDQNKPVALAPGEYIRIQVIDSGSGISQQNMERIFEPFFTTKAIGKGTGLGLATVSGLMKRLGGIVEVNSTLGKGTTFTVYIPREVSAATIIPTIHHKISHGHETILVVEDEIQVRTMIERALIALGYDVIAAGSGEQALEMTAHREINLVVSDVVMPGMPVQELIKNLRRRFPYVRILLISGHLDEAIADLLIKNVEIVSKPFSTEVLSSKIREILDSRDYVQ